MNEQFPTILQNSGSHSFHRRKKGPQLKRPLNFIMRMDGSTDQRPTLTLFQITLPLIYNLALSGFPLEQINFTYLRCLS